MLSFKQRQRQMINACVIFIVILLAVTGLTIAVDRHRDSIIKNGDTLEGVIVNVEVAPLSSRRRNSKLTVQFTPPGEELKQYKLTVSQKTAKAAQVGDVINVYYMRSGLIGNTPAVYVDDIKSYGLQIALAACTVFFAVLAVLAKLGIGVRRD